MKYAIVTGGARGLGLGIVNALFESKVVDEVAVIDLKLEAPPAAIASRVHGFTADVTDEKQVHHDIVAIARTLVRIGNHRGLSALCRFEPQLGAYRDPRGRAANEIRRRDLQHRLDRG